MSSRFNELYYGEPGTAADQLEHQEASEQEVRAALINALRRIERLEAQVLRMQTGRAGSAGAVNQSGESRK